MEEEHLPTWGDTCPLGGPLNRASEQKLCYTLGMAGGAPEWSGMELEGAGPTRARAGQWARSWDDKTEAGPGQPAGGQPQVLTQRSGLAQHKMRPRDASETQSPQGLAPPPRLLPDILLQAQC